MAGSALQREGFRPLAIGDVEAAASRHGPLGRCTDTGQAQRGGECEGADEQASTEDPQPSQAYFCHPGSPAAPSESRRWRGYRLPFRIAPIQVNLTKT